LRITPLRVNVVSTKPSMTQPKTHLLQAPGTKLYYEVRGSGPVLLLIPGGSGDAGPFERIANELANRFTVLTYDRRGFSRSVLDGPPDDARRLELDSEDAVRLIDQLTNGRAHVLGSSSGAIVALDLLTRHPDRIHTLVAHEPPLVGLLPDAAKYMKFAEDTYATYQRAGIEQAMMDFSAGIGMKPMPRPPAGTQFPPQIIEAMSRARGNFVFWIEHELRQYVRTVPDLERLKSLKHQLVLAGGHESRENFPYRPNLVIADRLGLEVVDFPGDHVGYMTHPAEFATQLAPLLVARP
jgi:pimeloyl-ACP methyl ester carboxylesterase